MVLFYMHARMFSKINLMLVINSGFTDYNFSLNLNSYINFMTFVLEIIPQISSSANIASPTIIRIKLKIKYVAYSSLGNHTGQLDFCN